mmetsp:Transcript_11065/g.31086  ORF Transcript_11065/g.31086 Transcript_11065/m.31086 type:complete len:244 (+) Transcript_11065:2112-2843(+)
MYPATPVTKIEASPGTDDSTSGLFTLFWLMARSCHRNNDGLLKLQAVKLQTKRIKTATDDRKWEKPEEGPLICSQATLLYLTMVSNRMRRPLFSLSAAPVRLSSQPVLALLPRRFGLLLPPPPPLPFDPRRFPPSATYPLSASAMEPGRCDPPRLARGLTSKRPNRILHRAVRQSVSSWWFLDATASRPAMALDAAPTAAASAALPSPQRLDLRCRSTVAEPLAGIVFPAAAAAASDGWWPVG